MSENVNNIFKVVQAETQCPYAKSAAISFARPIEAELSMSAASQQLYDDIVLYAQERITEAPDGLVVAISNTVIGEDFRSLTSGFNSLYRGLKSHDGFSEEDLANEDIENPGWQLTIGDQRLFTLVFSSLYPADHARHIDSPDMTFIFFQPVQSFSSRIPQDKHSLEFQKVKSNIRARFAKVGLPYDGAVHDDLREAAKYISPQHLGMQAVEWWKDDSS